MQLKQFFDSPEFKLIKIKIKLKVKSFESNNS